MSNQERIKAALNHTGKSVQNNIELRRKLDNILFALEGLYLTNETLTNKEIRGKAFHYLMELIYSEQRIARISELTVLDNAFDEVTPEAFHQYYIDRLHKLKAERVSVEHDMFCICPECLKVKSGINDAFRGKADTKVNDLGLDGSDAKKGSGTPQ
jgi:hypothetical protein